MIHDRKIDDQKFPAPANFIKNMSVREHSLLWEGLLYGWPPVLQVLI